MTYVEKKNSPAQKLNFQIIIINNAKYKTRCFLLTVLIIGFCTVALRIKTQHLITHNLPCCFDPEGHRTTEVKNKVIIP